MASETHPFTRLIPTAPYAALDDATLNVLFGQSIAKNICNAPEGLMLPGECSLYADEAHYALDAFNKPAPIHSADDFDEAMQAALEYFAPGSLETVTHYHANGEREIRITVAGEPMATWHYAIAGDDALRAETHKPHKMRRLTIICLLALANAPTTIADVTRDVTRTTEPTTTSTTTTEGA